MTRDRMMVDCTDYRTARGKVWIYHTFYFLYSRSVRFLRVMAIVACLPVRSMTHHLGAIASSKSSDDLEASPATVQAWHVLNERTMQGADPAGGGEKSTTIYNMRAVTVS